jgi:Tfp pilus assembly protein PilN
VLFFRNSTGIEIGAEDLSIAVAQNAFGKLRLVATHRLTGFMSLNESERGDALRRFIKSNRVPTSSIFLSLPRDQGIVRQIQLPSDITRKLRDIVKVQVETLSPWPAAEVYSDFAAETPKKDQKLVTVTIVIIPRIHLDPWITFFKSAGMPLSGATLSSVAYGHAITTFWPREAQARQGAAVNEAPTIVLQRGQAYTEQTLISGSRLTALTVPSSESGVARLLSTAKITSAEGGRLIVCGNAEPPDFAENPALPLENSKPDAAKEFGSVAVALVPLKEGCFRSNLLPPELRYSESRMRLIPALVLGLLTLFLGAALLVREPYQNRVYASELDRDIKKIAPQIKEVADQEKQLDQLSRRYQSLTSQLQNRDYVLETVGELARVLPASAFLASYSYQDGTITVSGLAQSASEIQNLLETSPVFKGVEFSNAVTREPSGKDRFTLKMVLEVQK